MAKDLVGILIGLFMAIVIVDSLGTEYPQFLKLGYTIIGAYVIGAGTYFKKKYF